MSKSLGARNAFQPSPLAQVRSSSKPLMYSSSPQLPMKALPTSMSDSTLLHQTNGFYGKPTDRKLTYHAPVNHSK